VLFVTQLFIPFRFTTSSTIRVVVCFVPFHFVRSVLCRSVRSVRTDPCRFVPFHFVRSVLCRSVRSVRTDPCRFVPSVLFPIPSPSGLTQLSPIGFPKDRPFNSLTSTNSRTYRDNNPAPYLSQRIVHLTPIQALIPAPIGGLQILLKVRDYTS
jgi:hypothetical protein